MPNHFHLLRHVPETKALSELELLERIEAGDMRTAQLSERNGELSLPECSRYLIRYFTYGVDPGGTYASTPAKEFCPAPDINFSGRSEM